LIPIDQFLIDFSRTVDSKDSLEDVGNRLADLVNQRISNIEPGGFHLCGYCQENGIKFPALYHIHSRPLTLHRDFPFELKLTVESWLEKLQNFRDDESYHIRNGEYDTYSYFSFRDSLPRRQRA